MIREAAAYLKQRVPDFPKRAVVLGSAQASFADQLAGPTSIPLKEIPGWPVPKVQGHAGELLIGTVGGVRVAVLAGRVHLYEGWTPQDVVFGVRVMGLLGVKSLVLTNAAGGINPAYFRGELVLLVDHINLQGQNPQVGSNDDSLGLRFFDMTVAYDAQYREIAVASAAAEGIPLGAGVYAAVLGPSFETPAEIRYLRAIGADLVGMSTVAETIAARHMGIRVLGFSTVTNLAAGMQAELSHLEVLDIGRKSSAALAKLLTAILPKLEG